MTLFYAWKVGAHRIAVAWWSAWAYLTLRIRGAKVGRGLRVSGPLDLHIHPTARVVIGDNCRIHSGFRGNAVGGFRRTGIWASRNAEITIGHGVGLSNCTLMARRHITIEDQVFVGGDCNIYDNDFHSLAADARLQKVDLGVAAAAVTLKRRSFIGSHVLILKGVTIGEEAVIGAGSVVTKDVPAGEIWAGNPARVIRKLRPEAAQSAGGH